MEGRPQKNFLIFNFKQAEAFCGDCRAGAGPVSGKQYFFYAAFGQPPPADINECADNIPYHIIKVTVGFDFYVDQAVTFCYGNPFYAFPGIFPLPEEAQKAQKLCLPTSVSASRRIKFRSKG